MKHTFIAVLLGLAVLFALSGCREGVQEGHCDGSTYVYKDYGQSGTIKDDQTVTVENSEKCAVNR